MRVTFFVIGRASGKSFDVPDGHELLNLNVGDEAEINHRSDNWDGSYDVIEKDQREGTIFYTILLRRLELRHIHSGHYKRWIAEVSKDGKTVKFKWGKINGTLQGMEKVFASRSAAANFVHEKIEEKLKKGYNQK